MVSGQSEWEMFLAILTTTKKSNQLKNVVSPK